MFTNFSEIAQQQTFNLMVKVLNIILLNAIFILSKPIKPYFKITLTNHFQKYNMETNLG